MKDLYLESSRKLFLQEGICASVAFTIALIINYTMKINHGYWLALTVGIMFAMPLQGMIVQRASDRMLGTIIGLLFSFFYLSIFAYMDYRWTYLLPLFFFLMYYAFYISNNYLIMVVVMVTYVPILIDLTVQNTLPLFPTMMIRLINTALGIIIALVCEYTIFRFASSSAKDTKYYIREYYKTIGNIISLSGNCFISHSKYSKNMASSIRKMMNSIAALESLYIFMRNEIDYTKNKEEILNRFFFNCNRTVNCARKILAIMVHDKLDESVISRDNFSKINNSISAKYNNIVKYVYDKDDDYKDKLDSIINFLEKKHTSPTYSYLSELAELNSIFDDYIDYVHLHRYPKTIDKA
ncbi:MAG TPA: hypothetical protein DD381_12060 [Lentisphaeria bacterium]|nr:MAG: hypothetical protein A2X47_09660 [Lentisphaerae bacterium GWF2_38_69]HBM17061.1 hypothetical protein [Lentisphaeria bacterium]